MSTLPLSRRQDSFIPSMDLFQPSEPGTEDRPGDLRTLHSKSASARPTSRSPLGTRALGETASASEAPATFPKASGERDTGPSPGRRSKAFSFNDGVDWDAALAGGESGDPPSDPGHAGSDRSPAPPRAVADLSAPPTHARAQSMPGRPVQPSGLPAVPRASSPPSTRPAPKGGQEPGTTGSAAGDSGRESPGLERRVQVRGISMARIHRDEKGHDPPPRAPAPAARALNDRLRLIVDRAHALSGSKGLKPADIGADIDGECLRP